MYCNIQCIGYTQIYIGYTQKYYIYTRTQISSTTPPLQAAFNCSQHSKTIKAVISSTGWYGYWYHSPSHHISQFHQLAAPNTNSKSLALIMLFFVLILYIQTDIHTQCYISVEEKEKESAAVNTRQNIKWHTALIGMSVGLPGTPICTKGTTS
jgi:hypothetical protein